MVLNLMDLTKLFSPKVNIIDKLYANYKGNSDKKFLHMKSHLFELINSLLNGSPLWHLLPYVGNNFPSFHYKSKNWITPGFLI